MARRPYSTDARFFSDSDLEAKIVWYPVAEPVECLPFPSRVNSLDWHSQPWRAAGVGEVFGAPRVYNGRKALPYAVGLTPCKPAETFTDGEPLDPSAPAQEYNPDGFPRCCFNVWPMVGGLEWDGFALSGVPLPLQFDPDCATAGLNTVTIGGVYSTGYGVVGAWVRFAAHPAPSFRLRLVDLGPNGTQINLWSGSCATPTLEWQLTFPGDTSPVLGSGGLPFFALTAQGNPLSILERMVFQVLDA